MNKKEFLKYVVDEVLVELSDVEVKNMFGGFGLYVDGFIFAFTTDDSTLMFKVDDSNRADYEDAGTEQFIYTGHKNKGPVAMPYWVVPEEVMNSPSLACEWANKSLEASRRSKKTKK